MIIPKEMYGENTCSMQISLQTFKSNQNYHSVELEFAYHFGLETCTCLKEQNINFSSMTFSSNVRIKKMSEGTVMTHYGIFLRWILHQKVSIRKLK